MTLLASVGTPSVRVVAGGQNVNKVESGVRLRYQYEDPDTGEQEEILIENTELATNQRTVQGYAALEVAVV